LPWAAVEVCAGSPDWRATAYEQLVLGKLSAGGRGWRGYGFFAGQYRQMSPAGGCATTDLAMKSASITKPIDLDPSPSLRPKCLALGSEPSHLLYKKFFGWARDEHRTSSRPYHGWGRIYRPVASGQINGPMAIGDFLGHDSRR
jgi:hypothetical protein